MKRNPSLDVLRGVAILLVLGRHSTYLYTSHYLYKWYSVGWTGVDLFFVLSGFLIAGLLFTEFKQTGRIDVRRFLIRRGFKIYPPFYCLIAITVLASLTVNRHVPARLLSDALFLGNYLPHVWPHCWSLAVEEHFYLILSFVLVLMIRLSGGKSDNPFRPIPLMSIALMIGCLLLRLEVVHANSLLDAVTKTHLRLDALFFGVTLAYFAQFSEGGLSWKSRIPLWLLGIVFLVPIYASGWSVFTLTIGLTCLFIGFGCILVWALNAPILSRGSFRPLAYIGRYSYSIYLWHEAVAGFVPGPSTVTGFALYFTSSIIIGIGLSKLIEMPALRLRDRMFLTNTAPQPELRLLCLGFARRLAS